MRGIFCNCILFVQSPKWPSWSSRIEAGSAQPDWAGTCWMGTAVDFRPCCLFHLAFWHLDLAPFGRGLLDAWPQEQIGLVLWSLSVAADEWQTPENLCRLCTIQSEAVLEPGPDLGPLIMEARILRPLYWFGLLEYRGEDDGTHAGAGIPHAWRKSALFDRFLGFEVRLEDTGAVLH